MRIYHIKGITFAALLVLCLLASFSSVAMGSTQTDARTAVDSAQNTMLNCYKAAQAAESTGANITALEVSLNNAGKSLSNAELAYSNGNYDSAVNYAGQCQSTLSNFLSEANAVKASGEQQQSQKSIILVGSIVGALVVVGAGYGVWLQLKKKYAN